MVARDPYVLTIHLPQGYRLRSAQASGVKAEIAHQAETATIRIVPSASQVVEWKLNFSAAAGATRDWSGGHS